MRSAGKTGAIVALAALGVAPLAASCGSSSSHGINGNGFVGVVFGYDDAPARGTPVGFTDPFAPTVQVGPDGRFSVPPVSPGTHVLKVGDSISTPTFFVAVVTTDTDAFATSPIFLPSLESGATVSVPPFSTAAVAVLGSNVDGVRIDLGPSTTVTYPAGAQQEITIVGLAPSRLPVQLPAGLSTRAAYAIEPHGARFAPPATLTLPRLEDASAGPWDLWALDETGQWKLLTALASSGTSLTATIDRGLVYAAVPRAGPAAAPLTGRVVSGGHPVPGYRVSCWGAVSDPTDANGRFSIGAVPLSFPAFLLRAFPARPGLDYAPEVAAQLAPTGVADAGDVIVGAPPANTQAPTIVSTSPADGAVNVPLQTTVSVQFSTGMDPLSTSFSVRGTTGVAAGRLFLTNAFTATFVPQTNLSPSDTYFITIDQGSSDLSGNTVDTGKLVFKFGTVAGAPPPPPTDQKIFGLSPLEATASSLVTLFGRNFPGGSQVKVGSGTALVRQETATTLSFLPPVTEPASDATVALVNSALTSISSLGPLVLDLRSSIASFSSATLVRGDPPTDLFVKGQNVNSGTVFVDGIAIAAIDSTELFGGVPSVVSKDVQLGLSGTLSSMVTGPVQVKGPNGKSGGTYRFLQIRDGSP